MPRKPLATDDQIMQASIRVLMRRGHDGFTLSEVAREVGLSRAAIILRFKSTQDLQRRLTTYVVDQFIQRLEALPAARSGDSLLELVAFIGGLVSTPGSMTAFMRAFHTNIADPELLKLEERRGDALRVAVSKRMPETRIAHESAVAAFMAHIGGSLIQWEVQATPDAREFLVARTRDWLALAGIAHRPA